MCERLLTSERLFNKCFASERRVSRRLTERRRPRSCTAQQTLNSTRNRTKGREKEKDSAAEFSWTAACRETLWNNTTPPTLDFTEGETLMEPFFIWFLLNWFVSAKHCVATVHWQSHDCIIDIKYCSSHINRGLNPPIIWIRALSGLKHYMSQKPEVCCRYSWSEKLQAHRVGLCYNVLKAQRQLT